MDDDQADTVGVWSGAAPFCDGNFRYLCVTESNIASFFNSDHMQFPK